MGWQNQQECICWNKVVCIRTALPLSLRTGFRFLNYDCKCIEFQLCPDFQRNYMNVGNVNIQKMFYVSHILEYVLLYFALFISAIWNKSGISWISNFVIKLLNEKYVCNIQWIYNSDSVKDRYSHTISPQIQNKHVYL